MTRDRLPEPALDGVLVTFRRPEHLVTMLAALRCQTRRLRHLVVVDNAPCPETAAIVRAGAPDARYVAAPENLGPAGGLALGMEQLLPECRDHDWILTLDDDDPPRDADRLDVLYCFAREMADRDPATAAVGHSGVRFDRRHGRVVRVPDDELAGAVPVDAIAGNQWPMYSVRAIRVVGPLRRELFVGPEELELGLRLRRRGFTLYGHGDTWRAGRAATGRLGMELAPSRALGDVTWRRYYSLRNLIWILRDQDETAGALRDTAVTGFAKPLANLVRDPARAWRHLGLNARACRDAWTGRMGRTVEPTP